MGAVRNRGTKEKPLWYCRYKENGAWKYRPTGQTTKAAAKVFVAEVEARIRRGLIGIPERTEEEDRAQRLTVRDLCEEYLKKITRRSIRDIDEFRYKRRSPIGRHILRWPIASLVATKVRASDVERWQVALGKVYAPNTCNAALNQLSAVYSWAQAEEVPGIVNPCKGVERLENQHSDEHYSMQEVHRLLRMLEMPDALWSEADRHLLRDLPTKGTMIAVALCLYTGLRRGELLGLTWPDIALEGEVPHIMVRRSFQKQTTKTGRSRGVPLHPEVVPYVRAWREVCPKTKQELVFPVHCRLRDNSRRGIVMHDRPAEPEDILGIHEIAKRAKCAKRFSRPWHAMRHSLATHLMEATGNGFAVSLILGHSAKGVMAPMTAGYINTSLRYLHAELCKMTLMPPPEPTPADVSNIEDARRRRKEQRAGAAP